MQLHTSLALLCTLYYLWHSIETPYTLYIVRPDKRRWAVLPGQIHLEIG